MLTFIAIELAGIGCLLVFAVRYLLQLRSLVIAASDLNIEHLSAVRNQIDLTGGCPHNRIGTVL